MGIKRAEITVLQRSREIPREEGVMRDVLKASQENIGFLEYYVLEILQAYYNKI